MMKRALIIAILCYFASAAPHHRPRHSAHDHRARSVIQHWTSDRIASARPRRLIVHSNDDRRAADDVANSEWDHEWGGSIQNAVGRIYFEMGGSGYVCSGTVVTDDQADRSVILTAAHCAYDDSSKAFATNVLFIPNQAGTSGSSTDTNCDNDPLGCWAPTFGVADTDWSSRTFPNNIPWDYAFYVVPAAGAHSGPSNRPDGTEISDNLEAAAGSLDVSFLPPDMSLSHALGYSFNHDPNFMYCAQQLGTQSAQNFNALWMSGCGLTGGSSGGPWIQGSAESHKVMSVNSWGFNGSPGMAGPRLDGANNGHAQNVFALAKCAVDPGNSAAGVLWATSMGASPCGDTGTPTSPPTEAPAPPTEAPAPESCTDKSLADGSAWHDSASIIFTCAWYSKSNRCERYGGGIANVGLTANQACCICGGGDQDTPPAPPPTAVPTESPSDTSCEDQTLGDGSQWHDSDGSEYGCEWYAERDNCELYGSNHANGGFTGKQACCVCHTPSPTAAPTNAPTEPPLTDLTFDDGSVWYDSEGTHYNCAWYAQREHCTLYGNEWANAGFTASQACVVCGGGEVKGVGRRSAIAHSPASDSTLSVGSSHRRHKANSQGKMSSGHPKHVDDAVPETQKQP